MPGARCTRGLVCKNVQKNAHEHTGTDGGIPTFPAQWSDGLWRALPGDQDLFVAVALRIMAEPPGWAGFASAGLDANHEASGPHAFAVRIGAGRPRAVFTHGPKPALPTRHAPDAAASTATRPNVRDDGQRPSTGTGCGRSRGDLGAASSRISEKQKFSLR